MRFDLLRERVRRRAGISSGDQLHDGTVLGDAVNLALLQIDSEALWPWLETEHTYTVAASDYDLDLPADFRKARGTPTLVWADGTAVALTEMSQTGIRALGIANAGAPTGFAVDETKLRIRPVADAGYTLIFPYYRTTLELVADNDEPLIPAQWQGAVISAAIANLPLIDGERTRKELAEVEVANWLRRMRSVTRRASGPVVPRIRPGGWV